MSAALLFVDISECKYREERSLEHLLMPTHVLSKHISQAEHEPLSNVSVTWLEALFPTPHWLQSCQVVSKKLTVLSFSSLFLLFYTCQFDCLWLCVHCVVHISCSHAEFPQDPLAGINSIRRQKPWLKGTLAVRPACQPVQGDGRRLMEGNQITRVSAVMH